VDPQVEPRSGHAAEAGHATESPPRPPTTPAVSAAVQKFRSCRWRAAPEDGEFCTHRDVLPFAGKDGFVAESWCPDCAFYKLRRTPKKRERVDYTY
jgi:predicted secreted protein